MALFASSALAQAAPPPAAAPATEPTAHNIPLPEAEAAYAARLDKLLTPLRDYKASAADVEKLKDAFKALGKGQVEEAQKLRAAISDPVARQLIEWERLRRGKADAADYLKFLADSPDWPSRELLRRRMEETLLREGGDTDVLATYFKGGEAQSAAGMAVIASMHLAQGEKDKAKALAVAIWREKDLPASLEGGFLRRFGDMLSQDDHKWRLDRLLGEDVRSKEKREARAEQAKRVIPLLAKDEQKTAQTRLSVFMRTSKDKAALPGAAAGKGAEADWGVVFHKVQRLRRTDKLDEAAKLLATASRDPAVVANLDEWWYERRGLAYQALKANKPKLAYELVQDAGPVSANELNDQSFMAGWIALRYLKDAKQAEKHFTSLVETADGPLTRSRGNYWMGRTLEVLGKGDRARASYEAAAKEPDTFHGQLALQKLKPGPQPLPLEAPKPPTDAEAARFIAHPAAKAISVAEQAGLGRQVTRVFYLNLAKIEDSEAWAAMAAHLARMNGDTQGSVRIGKAAIAAGKNLVYYSYPVHALPEYKPLRAPPETAMLLGLARQETEFNSDTVSGAGARGLLQVMKVTANHVCRDYKIKCVHKKLMEDDAYNIMMASAYVGDRMAEWQGSYVLALSSYNAGPGRTRQWVTEFGDPRTPGVDPIDWIERIPFEETRRYVAKVLSNIQIYRARLGETATALRLDEDLNRARVAGKAGNGKTSTADSRD